MNVRPGSQEQVDLDAAHAFEDVLAQPGIANAWPRVLQAIPLGFSVSWIEWVEKIRSTNPKRMLWPKALKLKPPTWFKFGDDMREPYLRTSGRGMVPLTPGAYFVHLHEGMSTIPIRGGIGKLCAWYYMFKKYAEKDAVNFNENFLVPWMIGTLAPGQSTTSPEGRIMAEAMTAIGHDMRALLTDGQSIKTLEANKPGTIQPILQFIDYIDKSYARAALGQNQTTDTTGLPHGAGKAISAKSTLLETIVGSDARMRNESARQQMAVPFTDLNWGRRPEYLRIDSDTEAQGQPAEATMAMTIAAQVKAGQVSRESGKTALQIFFALNGEQADALLGAETVGTTAPTLGPDGKPAPTPAVAPATVAIPAAPAAPAAPATGDGQLPVTDPLGTLNGAQIQQARGIVADYNAGVLTDKQALAQLAVFLNLKPAEASKLVGGPPTGALPPSVATGLPAAAAPPPAANAAGLLRGLVDRVGLDRLLERIAKGFRD